MLEEHGENNGENQAADRTAKQRRVAMRLASRFGISYEDGVKMRNETLRAAIEQTHGSKLPEEDLVWENLIPGGEDVTNETA